MGDEVQDASSAIAVHQCLQGLVDFTLMCSSRSRGGGCGSRIAVIVMSSMFHSVVNTLLDNCI